MSHVATNWAFAQRGLRPAEKLLLLCLADRHNPDLGCFPRQDTLARDAGMSRASVNDNLARLEQRGLIRREQRMDPRTRRQMATRYILAFEDEAPQDPCPDSGHGSGGLEAGAAAARVAKPCPESGHGSVSRSGEPCPDFAPSRVQNLDTNPVREPLDDDEERAGARALLVSRIREEGEIRLDGPEAVGLALERWRALGLTDAQILECVTMVAGRCPGAISRASYFDREMARLAAEAARPAPELVSQISHPGARPARRSRGWMSFEEQRAARARDLNARLDRAVAELKARATTPAAPPAPPPPPAPPEDPCDRWPTPAQRARMTAHVASLFPGIMSRQYLEGVAGHG